MSKKTRGPNFSSNEKEILVHLIEKYKDLVENKKTDAVTTAAKSEGWRKLADEFNSLSTFTVRNTDQLKTCWDNIKRNARKDKARIKKEVILTGGGRPNLPPAKPFQDQVEVLLGPTLSGLENPFDSDANYPEEDNEVVVVENGIDIIDNEPAAGPSTSKSDECSDLTQENEPAAGPSTSKSDECSDLTQEDTDRKMWSGWSPAALKTKVSENLVMKKNNSPLWLHRRRPKASVQDKFMESKLDLVERMKRNVDNENKMKHLIYEQQLKQEEIKTEILKIQLLKEQKDNL